MSWAAIGCSLTGLVLLDCCPKHATSSVAVAFPDALAGHAAARDMGGTARGAAGRLADGGGARMQGAADAVHSDAGRPAALPARHRARGRGAARTRGAAGRQQHLPGAHPFVACPGKYPRLSKSCRPHAASPHGRAGRPVAWLACGLVEVSCLAFIQGQATRTLSLTLHRHG